MATGKRPPLSSSSSAIVSLMVYSPAGTIVTTFMAPLMWKGTMMRWLKMPSGTVPSVSPAVTASPGRAAGVKRHFLLSSRGLR